MLWKRFFGVYVAFKSILLWVPVCFRVHCPAGCAREPFDGLYSVSYHFTDGGETQFSYSSQHHYFIAKAAWCSGPDWYEFGEFLDFAQKKSWQAAREDCLARGADLVSIHSPEEEIFLSSYSKGKTKWIGLSVNPVEGGYHWSDGTPVSHTNWGHGEPNNHNGRENCVEMVTTENGTSWWNDLNCDYCLFPHLCL
uniref:C-type lectin domain-containing protein n=1 Tax=Sinocyclocheilus grahami TaxID=75366 RepID=A0A672M0L6_SINGR